MKSYATILPLIIASMLYISCEKPILEDDGKKTDKETNDNNNKSDNNNNGNNDKNGDNGGWINDDKDKDTGNDDGNATYEAWTDGNKINVTYFINNAEDDDAVWVKGYIVGCATSSGGYKFTFEPPFEYNTSILLSDNKNEQDKTHTITIQLKSGSDLREELNLKDNPELHKKKISIYGYKTSYLKRPGMKDVLDYEWE